jgi:peptidoglycan endopeptidase LytE
VQLPAGGAVASTGTPGTGGPDAAAAGGDTSVYVVKSGDTLSKIAKANHTTYKKIMALNDLKTTSIKAGQKLKMPAPKETPATTIAPPTTTAATSSTTASN